MKQALLTRVSKENQCIRGVLSIEGKPICVTLELPWRDNQNNKSCIPPGEYICRVEPLDVKKTGGKGKGFLLHDVEGRDRVFIHVANSPQQLQGCIAVGLYFSEGKYGEPQIAESRAGFDKIFKALGTDSEFNLLVIDIYKRGYPKEDECTASPKTSKATSTHGKSGKTAVSGSISPA